MTSADTTLSYVMQQFKYTVALLYQALLNTEPIITQQLALISGLRTLGNVLLFVCFAMIMFVLVKTHTEVQHKRPWEIEIKKRWLVLMFVTFAISVGILNIYPSYKLSKLDHEIESDSSRVADAQARLFGFDSYEEAKRIAKRETEAAK